MSLNRLFCILIVLTLAFASCTLKETQVPPVVEPPPVVQPPPKPAKIALVLGAGSSKGFAHIGVLKILEGEKAAIEALPQITAIMTQLRQAGRLE